MRLRLCGQLKLLPVLQSDVAALCSAHSSRNPVRRTRMGFMKAEIPSTLRDGAPEQD